MNIVSYSIPEGRPVVTYWYWLSSQDNETLCTLGHEPGEFVGQDTLDFVRLLDLNADSHRVHGGFDEDAFVFISRDGQGIKQDFLRCSVDRLMQ